MGVHPSSGRLALPSRRRIAPAAVIPDGLSRRSVLAGGLGAASLAALAGCGTAGSAGAGGGAVEFWSLLSGADGDLMNEMIATVEQSVAGLGVDSTILAWGAPYYTKLAMSSAGGRAPEVAVLHESRLSGYAPGGLLEPWDTDRLAEVGLTGETVASNPWRRGQYDGQQYAVPLDTHPFILLYNTDLADQSGLLDADGSLVPMDTPEAFREAGLAMAEVTGQTGIAFGYVADTAQCWRLFYGLYTQGAKEIDLSGGTPEMDAAVAAEVIAYMQQLTDGTVIAAADDYVAALARFNTGGAGMILSGEWEIPGFQAAGVPLGATTIPALFGEPRAYADSHSFVLPRQIDPDPELRRLTYEFVAGILENSLTWAQAGHIPTFQAVVESLEYAQLEPQSSYAEAAEIAVFDPPAWFTGSGSDFQADMSSVLQTALTAGTDPAEVVTGLRAAMQDYLETPQPV